MTERVAPDRATVVDGPPDPVSRALEDVPRPYYCLDERGQAVHQTSATEMIERMLRLFEVVSGQRVLEIGTGSGFSTAGHACRRPCRCCPGPSAHRTAADLFAMLRPQTWATSTTSDRAISAWDCAGS